ncbi:hypothetical protein HPB47_022156 [Ixodes persulcatus]|uniref:Uncharacterized protein n=1 Tax=Ixodes persulcatus TaxID=34615 RepID=A0AC60QB67_IXOPE|nr:hypothetical protein HPB47_022156 [Ixodes persulcatus]
MTVDPLQRARGPHCGEATRQKQGDPAARANGTPGERVERANVPSVPLGNVGWEEEAEEATTTITSRKVHVTSEDENEPTCEAYAEGKFVCFSRRGYR